MNCLKSHNNIRTIRMFWSLCCVLIFILGLVSPYLFALVGVNFADEPYQILMAKNLNYSPLTFLTSILAGFWGNTFGWDILSMRYFAITIQLIPFLVGCYVMWRNTHRLALSMMIAGVCIFLMNGMFNFTLMGWDATSNASITCIGILVFYYCRNTTMNRVALLALFTCISVCIRFPNVVLIPIIMTIIGFCCVKSNGWKTALKQEIVYVATAGSLVMGVITLVYGSVSNYISIVRSTLISSHSLREMLEHWLELILYIFPFAILLFFALCTIKLAYTYRQSKTFVILVCVGWFVLYVDLWSLYMGVDHPLLVNHSLYAFFIVISAYIILKYYQIYSKSCAASRFESFEIEQYRAYQVIVTVAALLCISLVPGIGSNCGINKILSLSFAPLIVIYLRPVFTKILTPYCVLFVSIISPTVLAYKWSKAYNDVGIHKATTVCNSVKKFHHLYTTENRADYLQQLNALIEKESEGTTLVFISDCGPARYVGYYLSDTQPQYSPSNWKVALFSDTTYIDETKKYLQSIEGPVTLFILDENSTSIEGKMIDMIQSLNPSACERHDNITTYKWNNNDK